MTDYPNREFNSLSIHDARLGECTQRQAPDGRQTFTIKLTVESKPHTLIFDDCRLIRTDIKGSMARIDTVDEYQALHESDLLTTAGKWPSPLGKKARHYFITTSGGSRIDIIAESFKFSATE